MELVGPAQSSQHYRNSKVADMLEGPTSYLLDIATMFGTRSDLTHSLQGHSQSGGQVSHPRRCNAGTTTH